MGRHLALAGLAEIDRALPYFRGSGRGAVIAIEAQCRQRHRSRSAVIATAWNGSSGEHVLPVPGASKGSDAMTTTPFNLDDLGLPAVTTSELSAEHTARLAATIDAPACPGPGEALPLLWHWAHFLPTVATADLGPDGHPNLPPGPASTYPRRMWAAGALEASGTLVVGEPATRASTIIGTKASEGRSGALLIVRIEHRYRQFGDDRIVEEQTLIYRTPGPATPLPAGDHRPVAGPGQWSEHHTLDAASLFRFSAVTFNSHRIHYDFPYATGTEGYPSLVVHGPLTALLVGEALRHHQGGELARFEFRAQAPLFAGVPFTIVGTTGPSPSALVVRNDGVEAVQATATMAR